jgi:hypothetical protein
MPDLSNPHASNTFAPPMGKACIISFLLLLFLDNGIWEGARAARFDRVSGMREIKWAMDPLIEGDDPLQDTSGKQGALLRRDSIANHQPTARTAVSSASVPDSTFINVDTTAISRAPINIALFGTRPAVQDSAFASPASSNAPVPYGSWVPAYIQAHPYFKAAETSLRLPSLVRNPERREWMFYLFTGMLFYLALLKISFSKYFHDLFKVFFNSSLRQKQIREQLIQEPLPSLLLNLFFIASGGLFLYFLLLSKGLVTAYPKGMVLGACVLLLAAIYLVKYVAIRAFGWIFGRGEAVDTYLFVVFMVNKMAGLVLIPFNILIAYSTEAGASTMIILALGALCILALYRLIRGYSAIHKTLRINQLQFILFVAAFEVVPILLLYKGLNTLF